MSSTMVGALCFLLAVPTWGQEQSDPTVNLTIEPIKERFCKGDAEITFLQIQSRFNYSSQMGRVFLRRGDAFVENILIAKNETLLAKGEFLMKISRTSIVSPPRDDTRLSTNDFAALNTGETVSIVDTFDLPIVHSESLANRSGVLPGRYLVQLIVSTWQGSPRLASKTEQALGLGPIWTSSIRSHPVVLLVRPAIATADCSSSAF
jgi:hypothetical protein